MRTAECNWLGEHEELCVNPAATHGAVVGRESPGSMGGGIRCIVCILFFGYTFAATKGTESPQKIPTHKNMFMICLRFGRHRIVSFWTRKLLKVFQIKIPFPLCVPLHWRYMFVSLPKLVGGGHCYVRINRSQVQPHWHIHGRAVIAIVSPRFQFGRQFAKCHNRRADAYVHIHTQPTYHNTHGTELQIKQCVCTLFMVECGLALAEFHRMLMTFGLIENYL